MIDKDRFTCNECNHRGRIKELLCAANPFDPSENIYGCPHCKSTSCFTVVCDEADCWRPVSNGQPTKDGGYRQTCYEHGVTVTRENE